MSRNSKRLNPQRNSEYSSEKPEVEIETPAQTAKTPSPAAPTNPFGISFVVPTETVKLPTQGLYYPISSPMYQKSEIEIKFMTAKEEDILASSGANQATFEKLIDSIILEDKISASDILEEDKMAILMSARRTGYGTEYECDVYCENCGEPTKHVFDLSKVSNREVTDEESQYDPETNTFKFTLPLTGINLQLANITPEDSENIETEKKQKKKYNLPFNFTVSFLKTSIISANGVTNREEIEKLIDALPASDAKHILNFYTNCRPTIDTTQEVTCSVCQNATEREVPFSWAFFRTDV